MRNLSIQTSFTVIIIAASLLVVFAFTKKSNATSKAELGKVQTPNIIIILTDDQGYADVGFTGSNQISTPNIDKLAQDGVTFTNGYVSYSVCSPSRAGLLTGRYQDRFGYSRNPLYKPKDASIGIPKTEQTMAEYLKLSGYTSIALGKWHLGAHENFHPINRGFTEFYGFLGGGHRYMPEDWTIADANQANNEEESYRTQLMKNKETVKETEYITDALTREAVSFIERNKQQPFFMYLAYNAPHAPLQAPKKYLDRYESIQNPKRKTYAAMVSAIDDGVGTVINKLEQLKLTENTIVVFLSDNGGPLNDNGSNNGKLRGKKGSLWEGGIKVPFAMKWPKQIKAGTVYTKPVISLDIFATAAAQISPKNKPRNSLDGVDMLPYIKGINKGVPHEYLFWRHYDQKNYAVLQHSGNKLVIIKDSLVNLFNLNDDIGEQKNLASSNPSTVELLKAELKKWEANTIPPFFLGLNQEHLYNKN